MMRARLGTIFTITGILFLGLFINAKQAERSFLDLVRSVEKKLAKRVDKKTMRHMRPLFSAVCTNETDKDLIQLQNALSALYVRMLPDFTDTIEKKYREDFARFTITPKKIYEYLDVSATAPLDDIVKKIETNVQKKQAVVQKRHDALSMLQKRDKHLRAVFDESSNEQFKAVTRPQLERVADEKKKKREEIKKIEEELALLRQIKFYIGHALGKQEYDAYVTGGLDQLIIKKPKKADNLEQDLEMLIMQLGQRIQNR